MKCSVLNKSSERVRSILNRNTNQSTIGICVETSFLMVTMVNKEGRKMSRDRQIKESAVESPLSIYKKSWINARHEMDRRIKKQ